MRLQEVKNRSEEADFILVNVDLNGGSAKYIRPLDKDIREVFNPKLNKAFRQGECIRWVLYDKGQNRIGRIAAFVNKKYKTRGDQVAVGGIGFFDCICDQEAADMLFDVAKHWLIQRGMGAMDGPINFGERDRWWGLVTQGFQEPLVWMNFNPPYYQQLFETYGFRPFFNQICFGFDPKLPLSDKLNSRHNAIAEDPDYKVLTIQKKRLEKFARDFTIVYNKAYAGHGGLKELKLEQVMIMFRNMKPVLDERIVWFAYYKENPIAIFINLPDLNQWFKYLGGKFDFWHKLKFLWVKMSKPNRKFVGIVFATVPEFQGKGIDSFIVGEARKTVFGTPYREYEMQWIGDFNPKMINVAEGVGDVFRTRILTTYRYLFDRGAEFHRHPFIQ